MSKNNPFLNSLGKQKTATVGDIKLGNQLPFVLIGGPDSLEPDQRRTWKIVSGIKEITERVGIQWIMKASYDKAQRTSYGSFRGVGIKKGMEMFKAIKKEFKVSVTSDLHSASEAKVVRKTLDLIQIPAFLSRETDVLVNSAKYGKAVNIKKGPFMSFSAVDGAISKIESTKNKNLLITERGHTYGDNDIVVDMRSIVNLVKTGYPTVFDGSHTVQTPSGKTDKKGRVVSGGQREYSFFLCNAALSVGISAIFLEIYDDPKISPCDGDQSFLLSELESALKLWVKTDKAVKGY